MSTIDANDLGMTGYFLPEDSQLRLKQLREYVGFLTNLARPRRPDEDREWYSEIRPGEVAICMELLEEQIGQVLDELSWPAERGERAAAAKADAEAEAEAEAEVEAEAEAEAEACPQAEPVRDEAGNRLLFGVTLDQFDKIGRLLDSLRALGNVVTCSDHAELSDVTLSIMGDAIVRDVEKLRDIMSDVHGRRLEPPHATKPGVREEWATYGVLPPCLPMGNVPPIVRQLLTYQ
jgi:hypothetical protein